MTQHRAGRTGDSRRATGQGGVVIKRCQGCYSEVLSSYRGEVTAVGKGEIERVARGGDVIGRCECGRTVTWRRALPPPSVGVR